MQEGEKVGEVNHKPRGDSGNRGGFGDDELRPAVEESEQGAVGTMHVNKFAARLRQRRANSRGALVGALCALATLGYVVHYTSIAWTWYVAIGTIVTFTVGLLMSFATPLRTTVEER